MPRIDATRWSGTVIEQERATLAERGAEPILTLSWLSRVEVAQRERDAADEARCAALRLEGLRGAARAYASKRGR
jgi:hypothetical protein